MKRKIEIIASDGAQRLWVLHDVGWQVVWYTIYISTIIMMIIYEMIIIIILWVLLNNPFSLISLT